jgi:hypothetical protein
MQGNFLKLLCGHEHITWAKISGADCCVRQKIRSLSLSTDASNALMCKWILKAYKPRESNLKLFLKFILAKHTHPNINNRPLTLIGCLFNNIVLHIFTDLNLFFHNMEEFMHKTLLSNPHYAKIWLSWLWKYYCSQIELVDLFKIETTSSIWLCSHMNVIMKVMFWHSAIGHACWRH